MSKGVILEIDNEQAIVLTNEGEFRAVNIQNQQGCRVGDEVPIPHVHIVEKVKPRKSRKSFRAPLIVAASFLFVFVSVFAFGALFQEDEAIAFVSLDINPSVEISIDRDFNVLSITGWNQEGLKLIDYLDDELGKHLDYVAFDIIKAAKNLGYLNGNHDILLSTTFLSESTQKQFDMGLDKIYDGLEDKVLDQAFHEHETGSQEENQVPLTVSNRGGTIIEQDEDPSISIHRMVTTYDDREEALKHGISPARYVIYLAALEQGLELEIGELKEMAISQIAQRVGGLELAIGNSFFENIYRRNLPEEPTLPEESEEEVEWALEEEEELEEAIVDATEPEKPPVVEPPTVVPPAPSNPSPNQGNQDNDKDKGKDKDNDKGSKELATNKPDDIDKGEDEEKETATDRPDKDSKNLQTNGKKDDQDKEEKDKDSKEDKDEKKDSDTKFANDRDSNDQGQDEDSRGTVRDDRNKDRGTANDPPGNDTGIADDKITDDGIDRNVPDKNINNKELDKGIKDDNKQNIQDHFFNNDHRQQAKQDI
ncbi:anti-sigma factor domain-containing protein [Bacillus horti]|uniref:RsgI N-terminal anti-sigma domain-containing protein n=1 Tax=Caldalkalibacillus horti TaxID=77523 RepID=A0ABT9VTY6_9BACI|nr:anti-sigma factor domain-containing protein [Bacillus horti]MDQ0164442.1 hypothetical protein [Bacillus horti]